jgi:hypothetical protein
MIKDIYKKSLTPLMITLFFYTGCGGDSGNNTNSTQSIAIQDETTKSQKIDNQDEKKETRTLEDIQKQIEDTYASKGSITTRKLQLSPDRKTAVVEITDVSSGDGIYLYDIKNKDKAVLLSKIKVDEETYIGDVKIVDNEKFKYSIKKKFEQPLRFTHNYLNDKNISVSTLTNEDLKEIFDIKKEVLHFVYAKSTRPEKVIVSVKEDGKNVLYLYDANKKNEPTILLDGVADKFAYFDYDEVNNKLTYSYYESDDGINVTKYTSSINMVTLKKSDPITEYI